MSTHIQKFDTLTFVANTQKATASAEPPRKGIQKVNLSDLAGSLSKRGRERFSDPDLLEAFRESLPDGASFIWTDAVVDTSTDKALNASKAKWRSRAVSVFRSLGVTTHKVTIQWTDDHRMVVTVLSA